MHSAQAPLPIEIVDIDEGVPPQETVYDGQKNDVRKSTQKGKETIPLLSAIEEINIIISSDEE